MIGLRRRPVLLTAIVCIILGLAYIAFVVLSAPESGGKLAVWTGSVPAYERDRAPAELQSSPARVAAFEDLSVVFRAVDAFSEEPIAGAAVRIDGSHVGVTSEEGELVAPDVADGTRIVEAELGPLHVREEVLIERENRRPLLRLLDRGAIRGRILSGAGSGLPEARIGTFVNGDEAVSTDAEGYFILRGLKPGASYQLRFDCGDYIPFPTKNVFAEAGGPAVTVGMVRLWGVRAKFYDKRSGLEMPVPWYPEAKLLFDDTEFRPMKYGWHLLSDDIRAIMSREFVAIGMEPGLDVRPSAVLKLMIQHYVEARHDVRLVPLGELADADPVAISVERQPGRVGIRLKGVWRDTGNLASGFETKIVLQERNPVDPLNGFLGTPTFDEHGLTRIVPLVPATFRVTGRDAVRDVEDIVVTADMEGAEVPLPLSPVGGIVIEPRRADGRPVEAFRVDYLKKSWMKDRGRWANAIRHRQSYDGAPVRQMDLEPGEYELLVVDPERGWRAEQQGIRIEAGKTVHVEPTLQK